MVVCEFLFSSFNCWWNGKRFSCLDKMKDHYYCNNVSPGCKEACFSDFQPIEYWRLWVIEIVFVAAPAVFFVLYAHKKTVEVIAEKEKNAQLKDSLQADGVYHDGNKYYKRKQKVNYMSVKQENVDVFIKLGSHG